MKFVFVRVTNQKCIWLTELSSELIEKIQHFESAQEHWVKAKREQETEAIEKILKPRDYLILCDEMGKEFTSKGFSTELDKIKNKGPSRIVFAVGGAYGFDESLRSKANLQISLSKMTLNHTVAYAVLLEQVYRALAISKNHPYHHE
jgi:23S rRNA (pseudouridine1915-N3)-methyltransferase